MKSKLKSTLPWIAATVLIGGCNHHEHDDPAPAGTTPVADFDATVAREWFDLLTATIKSEGLNPPEASRRIAYAGVAFYEGLVRGMEGYSSLGGQLNELPALPAAPAGRMHWPAAANAAVAMVLTDLFALAQPATLASISDKEAELETEFLTDLGNDADALDRSIQHGQAVGATILAWIDGDDYAVNNDCAYTPPAGDGLWVPTGSGNALEPCWGSLRTFTLATADECDPLPHPTFSKVGGSDFANEAQEVYDAVNGLTFTQESIARFWADGGGTLTPPGHWVSITGQILAQLDSPLDVAAEAYARVGLAAGDAFISCWHVKFLYNLLRPVSYIQDPTGPINDPSWNPIFPTPPFPEYTSGHSTVSGACARVLTDLFGTVAFTDLTHVTTLGLVRSFASFEAAADEAAISRLFAGIHYRSAIDNGVEGGECIGQLILDNVQFRN
jgi:hypothetical protein